MDWSFCGMDTGPPGWSSYFIMITLAAALFILIGVACMAIAFFVITMLVLQWRDGTAKRSDNTNGLTA